MSLMARNQATNADVKEGYLHAIGSHTFRSLSESRYVGLERGFVRYCDGLIHCRLMPQVITAKHGWSKGMAGMHR